MRLVAVGLDSADLLEKLHMLFLSSGLFKWTQGPFMVMHLASLEGDLK